jgi:enoyl-CoA hydratase/carnithine racemase
MCDVRVAADTAVFAESFVKLDIVPGDGGAWLLPRAIGFARAAELSLTGETFDAAYALEIGLVSRVVPAGELLAAARTIADKIAANPPHAVRMTRRLLREAQTATLAATLELSAAMQSLAHATRDNDEAIDAFIERRAPDFTGE